jgi:uncharacterized protein (TIGR03437 family)
MRLLSGILVCAGMLRAAGATATLASFPDTGINAVQVDSAGYIYVAGFQGEIGTLATYDAFVAKISPDGSKVVYSTKFAGSKYEFASALALDATGNAYILGETQSPDFPVTAGASQATLQAPATQGFVAKVDPQGKVVYATFIGGSANISTGAGGLLADSAGNVFVSGQDYEGAFPTTPGAVTVSANPSSGFVMKLGPDSTLLASVVGIGGQMAFDTQGNLYVAGALNGEASQLPATAGAFQSTFGEMGCGGDAWVGMACSYQYVTKLNSALTQILYMTYVAGTYGAQPVAIAVDAEGNATVAGTTNSPDYPTTPNAFQPFYEAQALPPPAQDFAISAPIYPPPASGYVTRLNSTGTGLIYSTFFSGTQDDTITFAAITGGGIYFAGQAGSPDLPGLDGAPSACLPESYTAEMSLDGSTIAASRLLNGTVLAYDAETAKFLAWTGTNLVSFDPTAPPSPITCILDSADLRQVTAIAPGELVSIYGPFFLSGSIALPMKSLPTSIFGVSVTFNGTAAPILYASNQQMNLQAPYEIAGSSQVELALTLPQDSGVAESVTLAEVTAQPAAFLTLPPASISSCPLDGGVYTGGPVALAFNADGSQNTCFNQAPAGTTVTMFLQGLGVIGSAATAQVNTSPTPLTLPVTITEPDIGSVVSANALVGSLAGIWQVGVQIAPNNTGAVSFSLAVGIGGQTVAVRDQDLTIFVK